MRSLLLLAFPALVGAMELTIADIGVTAGAGPDDYGFTIDNGTTSVDGDDTVERSVWLRLGVRKGFPTRARSWGPVVGVDLGAHRADLGTGRVDGAGLGLFAGFAWAPFDAVAFLAGPTAGIGRERIALDPTVSRQGLSADGTGLAYGARATMLVNLSRRWLAAWEVGWETSTIRCTGDGAEVELRPHGPTVGIGLVWRFDPMPVRLE